MREYQAIEWFHIKGRGEVVSVENDEEFPRDTGHLIGETVKIDGAPYVVRGVESFAVTPVRKGAKIGLLVVPPSTSTAEHGK